MSTLFYNKFSLLLKTQNKKGNEPQFKENLGFASVFLNNNVMVSIDLFEGHGNNCKRLDQPKIQIAIDGKNLFVGNQQELKKLLTTN